MRKIKDYQVIVLLATILLVTVFHACMGKKETTPDGCQHCYALQNGTSVAEQDVCNESEKTQFRNAHPGTELSCY
jgi:hypothetical protein